MDICCYISDNISCSCSLLLVIMKYVLNNVQILIEVNKQVPAVTLCGLDNVYWHFDKAQTEELM